MDEVSIQDRLLAGTSCFGCGPENAKGLRLKSFPVDGEVRAVFLPWPEHDNGLGFLNGGIISTVLDCHSAAAVLHEADLRGWKPFEGLPLSYVTAGLDVKYLRPSPLREESELVARVVEADESRMLAVSELLHDGKIRASATAEWRRWRPRS
ncbi:MAG TPA: PaaI family thioesterase [Candidatus Nanopelagicales bacterium]|nr:PaaI family thioesterase [Candidatus Nanopelagicales bacterium]